MAVAHKILVVDDEPRMCESLENLLSMQNYDVASCRNGRDALAYLKTDPVDLVLLDLFMEEMDGFEVLEQLSAQRIDTMVIIITGKPSVDSAVGSFRKGGCDYLRKPFQTEELFISVQKALERRKIEKGNQVTGKKLLESEARFRRFADNIKDVLYRVRLPDCGCDFVSSAAFDLFGYIPEEFYTTPMLIREFIHPAWKKYFEEQWRLILLGKIMPVYEYQIMHKFDGERWIHQRNLLIFDNAGHPVAMEGIATDITELKRVEDENKRLEKKLHQSRKMEALSRMAGALAHQFNNHLSVVTGNLEMALDNQSLDREIRRNLLRSMKAARQTANICGHMLTYLGKSISRKELIDLSEILHQHLPALEMSIPNGIFFTANLMPSGPIVRANAGELKDVLSHLVTNACEAIADGCGTISLSTYIAAKSEIPKIHRVPTDWDSVSDTFACIEVTDSGCGMSEETMDKAFDPFFSTKFIGRGLGLSVVSGVIRACGGTICVASGKDKGSKFRIFLPLVAEGAPKLSSKKSHSGNVYPNGAVLLVEDEIMVRHTAEEMLKRIGFSVITAASGAEAVEKIQAYASHICCVITDLTMPGMDGWNTLAALRKIRPKIPAILIGGYDERIAMGGDHEEQPQVFLHKPYSAYELSNALAQIIRSS